MSKSTSSDSRRSELAMIHIAKKELGMDRETYEMALFTAAAVTSSSDLDSHGRAKVIEYFKSLGWKPKPNRPQKRRDAVRHGRASPEQLSLIRHIWTCLAAQGVIRSGTEAALRVWIHRQTARMTGHGAGYAAPEFLPQDVAIRVIEMLKKWAARAGVEWEHPDG